MQVRRIYLRRVHYYQHLRKVRLVLFPKPHFQWKGVLEEKWDGLFVENDNGVIKWNDILNQEPVKFNFTQSTSQPSILHGNGHVKDITSRMDGIYIISMVPITILATQD